MIVVIFKATLSAPDNQYLEMSRSLRAKAMEQYGCLDFTTVTEGLTEVALSYWPDEEHLLKWKQDTEHLQAQKLGREKWYKSYHVQIARLERTYGDESTAK